MSKVLLVNPNNRILSPYAGIEPPLWAGLIASDLRNKGEDVAILDAEALDYSVEQTAGIIREQNPDQVIIVVMGNNPSVSSTPKIVVTKALVERLNGIPLTVTGLHPSALPRQTEEELGIEVVEGKIFGSTPDIPFDLLPMDRYVAHNWHCLDGSSRKPYASVYTSLGCPFNCAFCNVHALYNGRHRVWYRGIDALIAEIDLLVNKYHVRNIKFWDELFTLHKERVKTICDRLIEKSYDLNIWAYSRVDTVTPSLLAKMRKAGITWLAYGFESSSNNVLGQAYKRATTNKAIRAVSWTHDIGINVMGNFIFGLPGETNESREGTLDFAKNLGLDYVNFNVAELLPGSSLYKGQVQDWFQYGQYSPEVPEVCDIKRFRDKAFTDFFTDVTYLAHTRQKFGEQAVTHIHDMLAFGKPVTRVRG